MKILIFLFVFSTPIGIMFGGILDDTYTEALSIAYLQSFAGGTLAYLSLCDLLIHEFHNSMDITFADPRGKNERDKAQKCISFVKFVFFVLGFIIVSVLVRLTPNIERKERTKTCC